MTRLDLAITDFALPAESDSTPRLAMLERLLARGRRSACAVPSWRHWLLQRSGVAAPAELPLAAWLAGREGCFALATPLHLLAGLEHVHLDPAGPPRLDAPAWQALADGFNAEFGQDGLHLGCEGGLGLLSLPQPLAATTHDPGALAGRDAGAWLPSGPDGGWLRRTMTSIQMWLHDHPLNSERASAGQVPVNALWLWAVGSASAWLPGTALPALATDDEVLRHLWRSVGARATGLPSSFEAWQPVNSPQAFVALSLAGLAHDPRQALDALESGWLAPVAAAVQSGRLAEACLHLGASVLELSRTDLFRFWRRRRAWHEVLR